VISMGSCANSGVYYIISYAWFEVATPHWQVEWYVPGCPTGDHRRDPTNRLTDGRAADHISRSPPRGDMISMQRHRHVPATGGEADARCAAIPASGVRAALH